jgi:hypothetical protein
MEAVMVAGESEDRQVNTVRITAVNTSGATILRIASLYPFQEGATSTYLILKLAIRASCQCHK